jgi:hypothetical protein
MIVSAKSWNMIGMKSDDRFTPQLHTMGVLTIRGVAASPLHAV